MKAQHKQLRKEIKASVTKDKVRGAYLIILMQDGSRRYKALGRAPVSRSMAGLMA